MKAKVYVRVAKDRRGKAKVGITTRPSSFPITGSDGSPLPTVAFAVMLDVPDALFRQAEQVIAEIRVPEEAANIAADVQEPPQ